MRRLPALAVVAVALLALLGRPGSAPAQEGQVPQPARSILITKVVEGPLPLDVFPGGFDVELVCTEQGVIPLQLDLAARQGNTITLLFELFNDDQTCSITETGDLGAESTTYECIDGPPDQICQDPQTVVIDVQSDQSQSQFVITNTFAEVDDDDDDRDDVDDDAVDVVPATPTFTG